MSKYDFVICAVLRNESLYVAEWLNHYIRQGVQHFYLYDNQSTDSTREVCKPYADKITWRQTFGLRQQVVAYNHFIEEYGKDTKFAAFLDADEFLYTPRRQFFVPYFLSDWDLPGVSAIAVHWLLFGSNGEKEYRPEPVLQRFTKRAASVNGHVKSIVRMSDAISMGNDPHSFRVTGDVIDENMNVLPRDYAISYPATADILRLNHYYTKSKAEHKLRKQLPDANSGVIKSHEEQFLAHDVNEVEDRDILCYLK